MTFPNEAWPSDAAVQLLDGTIDPATGLPYIPKGTGPTSAPSLEIQYNRRLARENTILAALRQGMVVDEGNLQIGVYPVNYTLGGARRFFSGATGFEIPDDVSRVVYIDTANTLQIASTWPTDLSTFLPLAIVTTVGGQMQITDYRVTALYSVPTLESAGVSDRRIVSAHRAVVGNSESDTEIFEFEAPEDLELDELQVYCSAVSSTASVDVKADGVSMVSSAATPAGGAVVKPTIASPDVDSGDSVTVHVTTDGGGSIDDLAVTLIFKAPLAG